MVWVMPSVPIGVQIAGADHVHRDRNLFDGGAEAREPLCRLPHAFVDGGLGADLLKAFLDDADLHALDAGAERLGVVLDLRAP